MLASERSKGYPEDSRTTLCNATQVSTPVGRDENIKTGQAREVESRWKRRIRQSMSSRARRPYQPDRDGDAGADRVYADPSVLISPTRTLLLHLPTESLCRPLVIAEARRGEFGLADEECREVRRVAEAELGRDRGDREIGVSEQAAGFEGESILDGLLRCLPGSSMGGAGESSTRVAQRVGIVRDIVRDGEVALKEVTERDVEGVLIGRDTIGCVAADFEDQDREQVSQRFGFAGARPPGFRGRRVLATQGAPGAVDRCDRRRGVVEGHRAESIVGDLRGLGVGNQEVRLEEDEVAGWAGFAELLYLTGTNPQGASRGELICPEVDSVGRGPVGREDEQVEGGPLRRREIPRWRYRPEPSKGHDLHPKRRGGNERDSSDALACFHQSSSTSYL